MKVQSDVMDRGQAMWLADALLKKPTFSHEDNAKVGQLLRYAEMAEARFARPGQASETRARKLLNGLLRGFNGELRALGVGTSTTALTTAALVKEEWRNVLTSVLAATDDLFDPEVVTVWESDTGAPTALPIIDDTAQSATVTAEGDPDPTTDPTISAVKLDKPSTYRTNLIQVSRELVQDSSFSPVTFLAMLFAVQFQRGVGPDLVSELLSTAKAGRTAVGSSGNTGGAESGATSIGTADLAALRTSVNSAYRVGPSVGWGMNDDTLSALDSLLDKNGRPIFDQDYDSNGRRRLFGFPVFTMRSMPSIASGHKSVAFGNWKYWVTRIVKGHTSVGVLQERYAELGLIAYHGSMRCNGKLLAVTASDSPIKYLVQA